MYFDSRRLDDGVEITTTVCIMGGGAAGITLARELAAVGCKVAVLEGGGIGLEPDSQKLYEGRNTGEPYDRLDVCRLRQLGGATNHWGGWTRPLETSDFQARDWVGSPGWPLREQELAPFYDKAAQILQLGPHRYELGYWEQQARRKLGLDQEDVASTVFRMSPPTRFGFAYGPEFQSSPDVDVYLYANITDIQLHDNLAAVRQVECRTLNGRRFRVKAAHFVLATGGIENARLLLASNRQQKAGLGNQHGLVGRYFSDHRGMWAGALVLSNPKRDLTFYRLHKPLLRDGSPEAAIVGALTLDPAVIVRERLPNFCAFIAPSPDLDAVAPPDELAGMGRMQGAVQSMATFAGLPTKYGVAELPDLRQARPWHVIINAEAMPCAESRVSLGPDRDVLGMPRAVLHLAHERGDEALFRRTAQVLARALGAAGIGRMYVASHPAWPPRWQEYGRHHMGTTRMSDDPRRGVVDRDCRVHGLSNLYVAGSSVFPSYGFAQPTFTIVALALRLAQLLRQRVAGERR